MKNGKNDTFCHIAAHNGKSEALSLLLQAKYDQHNNDGEEQNKDDINIKNNDGKTALILAARNGHRLCLEVLIQHNADVDIQGNNGGTALLWAAYNGHTSCLEFLIQCNADINIAVIFDGNTQL